MTYGYETNGSKSAHTVSSTLSGHQLVFDPVTVTAGALKLSNQASCTPTSSAAAAAATAVREVYKLMIVPGAAALLGNL